PPGDVVVPLRHPYFHQFPESDEWLFTPIYTQVAHPPADIVDDGKATGANLSHFTSGGFSCLHRGEQAGFQLTFRFLKCPDHLIWNLLIRKKISCSDTVASLYHP